MAASKRARQGRAKKFAYQSDDEDHDRPLDPADNAPADQGGRPMEPVWYFRNGSRRLRVREADFRPEPDGEMRETPKGSELARRLSKCLSQRRQSGQFTRTEIRVMETCFGDFGVTLEEIGKRVGVSKQRVWQITERLCAADRNLFGRFWRRRQEFGFGHMYRRRESQGTPVFRRNQGR